MIWRLIRMGILNERALKALVSPPMLISLGLHVGAFLALLALPDAQTALIELSPQEVTIDVRSEEAMIEPEPEQLEPLPFEEPEPLPPEEQTPELQTNRLVPQVAAMANNTLDPSQIEGPIGPPEQTSQIEPPRPVGDRSTVLDPGRRELLLDPTAVARGAVDWGGSGPSRPGPPAGRNLPAEHGPSVAELNAQHSGFLREQAMTKRHTSGHQRPQLRRRSDGSYAYAGHSFNAEIRPDGQVIFRDQDNVRTDGFSSSGSFDITDAIMGASGQDPHRAEREWFMRHTEELRDQLEDEWRARTAQQGLGRLRARLARVWAADDHSFAARRRLLFRIWDECDEGGDGTDARRAILTFVRVNLPQGSENAFTEEELRSLNARRSSSEAFSPY